MFDPKAPHFLAASAAENLDYNTETDVINNSRPRNNYMSQYERVLCVLSLVGL